MTKGTKLILFFLALASLSWGVYECKYYYSYYTDLKDRPWAYSRDKNAKLLVGTWQGEFSDPNNVTKTIRLTILPPVSDEERAKKAARQKRKRSGLGPRTDKKRFDGIATVTSPRGQEEYELNGHVQTEAGNRLAVIHFQAGDEFQRLRNNFNLLSALEGGQWQGDDLTFTLAFAYTTATGSSYSSSSDPRYEKTVPVHLSRIK
ncbi:hypothetical protein EXU85_21405 [Spirosoma sp. KCTC 42546]|uniref:hypothetical protein n=1 Tax=Spirosoma sp. KCTC 42546 TaxID=2520506 RepID=UPI001157000A|nr:hypothetical protein [Spirosoma sp. KCTC 42546]QDK81030.1 hypothetical protein EXU85_21405 [Spirosoma sp. KCTC 42546]